MAVKDINRQHVLLAIEEYDRVGIDAFLAQYGYGYPKSYWLTHESKSYPSKAILGVAHKFVGSNWQSLRNHEFTGGISSTVRKLQALGFSVSTSLLNSPQQTTTPARTAKGSSRNPTWNREELLLALGLYLSNPSSPPSKRTSQVAHLAEALTRLRQLQGLEEATRTINAVYLKMMNFRALDPTFQAQGKVGMSRGGKLEAELWREYSVDVERLNGETSLILSLLDEMSAAKQKAYPDAELLEAPEGGALLAIHKRYERDAKLIRAKKQQAERAGKLFCELCAFDFRKTYGALGTGYIEVHHKLPVHQMVDGQTTRLDDLALLCANCHRMAHRTHSSLSLIEIQEAMQATSHPPETL